MGAVVGVDPSITSTGVFVLGAGASFARVQSKPAGESLSQRLDRMRAAVMAVRMEVLSLGHAAPDGVDLIVIEGPAFASNNAQTHMLSGFWWLLAHALEKIAPVAVVQPSTLKKFATGNGRAGKDEMLAAAIAAFPQAGIRNNDVADAAALAACGAVWLGRAEGGVFAPSGMASVQAVRWPEMKGSVG